MIEPYEPRRPCTTRPLRLGDVRHCVNEWGPADGPLVFFLHGWGDCGRSFQMVVDGLPDHWRIVAPDWRGFGETTRNTASYWFPEYLADLDALLGHFTPSAPAKLIAHSMGGNAAGLYAGAMPERVSAFVNIEGFGLADSDPAEAPSRYRDWLIRSRGTPEFRVFDSFDALTLHLRQRNPAMTAEAAAFVARCWARESERGVELLADPRHKLPNPVLYRRAEAEACWRQITAKTLLVAGADSRVYPAGTAPEASAADLGIGGARLTRIAGAGHMVHFEAPTALAAVITDFLAL